MTGPMSTVSRRRAAAGLALVLLAVVAIVFPVVFSSPVVTNYAVYALIFVAVVTAWNMFSGFSGYISLGQAVFFGSGAYAVGIAAKAWHINGVGVFALLPLAAAVGAVIAVPFGLIALRVRRHTFIVVTIAVFFIFQLMAFNLNSFTGGTIGMSAPFLPWTPTTFNDRFYYITLACAVVAVVIAVLVRRSRFGLQLRAIKDDEDRARGLGVRTMRVKLAAFVLSATITGLVGGVWFLYLTQVLPQSGFDPLFDLSLVLMAFLGGLGTITGPIIGALIIEPGQLYLTIKYTNGYLSEILLGALFLLIVLFVPRGIVPTAGEWLRRLRTRGRPAVRAGPDVGPGQVRPERRDQMTALLRTEGVRKAYGGVHALDTCTVEVEEGTVAGLIGPNGSGKTTLFNVITGYAKADAGHVYLADRKITNVSPDKVFALGIGRTFQLTRIFASLTVLENMLVASPNGRAAARRRAMEQLDFVGIAGHHAELAGTLSYGQRKLLELAYVLVADPAVILLDEPAGGVNLSLVNHIADRIRELNAAGTTFLIVEHNMEFVMGLCDRVTVLDSGTVVASGPPGIIRTDRRVLNAYLGEDLEPSGGRMSQTGAGTQARSVLKITDLVAGYGGGDVLRGVSLEVAEGGITCVVGPNGAGKSTLMAVDQRPAAAAPGLDRARRPEPRRDVATPGAAARRGAGDSRTTACSAT